MILANWRRIENFIRLEICGFYSAIFPWISYNLLF